jgi:hypothetical protein
MSAEDLEDVEIASGLPEDYYNAPLGGGQDPGGSNFGGAAPAMEDQAGASGEEVARGAPAHTQAKAPRNAPAPRPIFTEEDEGEDTDVRDSRIPF